MSSAGGIRNRGARMAGVLVALACVLVATVGLKLSDPDPDVTTRGVIGRPVELNGGEVTVLRVRSGSTVAFGSDGSVRTPGLFIVATVRLQAPRLEQVVNDTTLQAGALRYQSFTDASLSADSGFQSTGDLVFEVDPTRLDGLSLVLAQAEVIHGVRSRVQIGLGITDQNAARWRQTSGQTVQVQQFPSTEAMP